MKNTVDSFRTPRVVKPVLTIDEPLRVVIVFEDGVLFKIMLN